jgi:cytidine deaminase
MHSLDLTAADTDLIAAAKALIARAYLPDRHHLAAAVRTHDGRVFTGLHIEANVGRVTVCAEAITIGRALSEGASALETIVAVRRADDDPSRFTVVSPCGMCRELIVDYMPQGFVLCVEDQHLKKVPVLSLLPGRYDRDTPVLA